MSSYSENIVIVKELSGQLNFTSNLSQVIKNFPSLYPFGWSIYKLFIKHDFSFISILRNATLKFLRKNGILVGSGRGTRQRGTVFDLLHDLSRAAYRAQTVCFGNAHRVSQVRRHGIDRKAPSRRYTAC